MTTIIVDDSRDFYNDIYTRQPWKWSSIDRNYLAFKILSAGLLEEPRRMLDFGCGNGHTLAFFHSQWPHTQYIGVDISDVALELTAKRVPEALTFKDWPDLAEYDVIIIMGVAEHFENPANELRKIGQMLKPTGYLYLEIPNCLAYSDDKTEGFRQTHAGGGQKEWHWHRGTWERVIQECGFDIIKRFSGFSPAWEYIWVLRGIPGGDGYSSFPISPLNHIKV